MRNKIAFRAGTVKQTTLVKGHVFANQYKGNVDKLIKLLDRETSEKFAWLPVKSNFTNEWIFLKKYYVVRTNGFIDHIKFFNLTRFVTIIFASKPSDILKKMINK